MIKKFFAIGIVSTIIDYVIYSILIYFGIAYYIAIVIGYITGFLANFFLARKKVFTKGSYFNKSHHEFMAAFAISIVAIFLNILIVEILAKYGINYYIGRIIALLLVFFFNFYTRKGFVYVA